MWPPSQRPDGREPTAPSGPRRGAPPAGQRLGRQAVVDRARELIARDGFADFSVRALAADLGVRPAALYNHVRDRDDLLDAVADQFAATFALPDTGGEWADWMGDVARRLRRHMVAHPHLTDVVLTRPAAGPARPALLRGFLQHLERAGVEPAVAHVAWHALLHLLIGSIRQERSSGRDGSDVFEAVLDVVIAGVQVTARRPADPRATELLREHQLM